MTLLIAALAAVAAGAQPPAQQPPQQIFARDVSDETWQVRVRRRPILRVVVVVALVVACPGVPVNLPQRNRPKCYVPPPARPTKRERGGEIHGERERERGEREARKREEKERRREGEKE